MIRALLIIRWKQIYRAVNEIGLFRVVFLAGLFAFFVLFLYTKASNTLSSRLLSIGFLFLIWIIHVKRGDKLFLKSHFSNYKLLILSEYLILSLPVMLLIVIHQQWISLIGSLGLWLIINFDLKIKHLSLNTKLQELIPSDSFEWKAGLRKHFYILVPLWIIAMATSFFVASVPIAIFILGLLMFSFFENGESSQILLSYEYSPKKLILHKMKRQIQLFSISVLPLIGMFLLFNFDKWYIPVAEYLIFCFLHIYLITAKYTFYEPNKRSPAVQILGGIGLVGGIIPIFLPVVWFLTIWFFHKSVNNLNFYLDDYN